MDATTIGLILAVGALVAAGAYIVRMWNAVRALTREAARWMSIALALGLAAEEGRTLSLNAALLEARRWDLEQAALVRDDMWALLPLRWLRPKRPPEGWR